MMDGKQIKTINISSAQSHACNLGMFEVGLLAYELMCWGGLQKIGVCFIVNI